MNLDALTAELLGQPLDQFTSRRNAKVKELKASGHAELARDVSALKKPSLPLWAVNHVDPAILDSVRSGAQAVARAQAAAASGRSNAARDLRVASEEFQRRLESAGTAAAGGLREFGHPAGEEMLRRVREILRLAALEGGETWERLRHGALVTEPRPREDMLELFGGGGARPARGQAEQAEARRAAELAQRAARADEERAERATQTARRFREEATEAAAAARRAEERAMSAEQAATRARAQAKKSQRAAGPRTTKRP